MCDGMGERVDDMGSNLMNYYRILMNFHRKTTAINRSFAVPLHSTYHKANAKHRVGASGQYKSY